MCFCFGGCFENKTKTFTNSISNQLKKAQVILIESDNSNEYVVNINNFEENQSGSIWQQIDFYEDQLEYMICYFNTKLNSIESLCKIIKSEKLEISKRQEIIINDMLSAVVSNAENVQKINEKIKTRISNLQNSNTISSMQTRNLYINNLCNYTDNIYNILGNVANIDEEVEVKQSSWHNVDSYQNNKNSEQNNSKNNDVIVPNYYGYNGYYGKGMTNPFYYGGYGGFGGYGMYGGMFPFGRNPYMPNVDTFGVYKNIDTYKPIEIKQTKNEED